MNIGYNLASEIAKSKVTPVYKKHDSQISSNYSPTSVLYVLVNRMKSACIDVHIWFYCDFKYYSIHLETTTQQIMRRLI